MVSSPVKPCKKIFLLYPPTQSNLIAFDGVHHSTNRLRTICHDLEGGLMVPLDYTQALAIPSGCLHAVFTHTKGWLVTLGFMDTRTLKPMSACIAHNSSAIEGEDEEVMLQNWFGQQSSYLTVRHSEIALEAWRMTRSTLLCIASKMPAKRRELRDLWVNYQLRGHWRALEASVREKHAAQLESDIEILKMLRPEEGGKGRMSSRGSKRLRQ